MVTRWAHNPKMVGSIPTLATIKNGFSNLKNLFRKNRKQTHSELIKKPLCEAFFVYSNYKNYLHNSIFFGTFAV